MPNDSNSSGNITYRLSPFDSFCFGVMATFGYVLSKKNDSKFPSPSLLAAVHRAADKWRLLASRIVQNPDNRLYYMNVPTDPLPPSYPVVNFSESEYPDETYGHTPIPTSFSSSYVIVRPDPQYFRTPSIPSHVSALAQDNSPILFIHISHFSNATCVGFSIPHGIFDGTGMGMVINAINDEFSGREWAVPPLAVAPGHEVTTFEEAISALPSLPPLPPFTSQYVSKTEFDLEMWKREIPTITTRSLMRFRLYMAYETLVQNHEAKVLYLSERAIKAIVERVKAQVKKGGDGWVSTGDILVAWFVKASLSKEPHKLGPVSINTTVSFRDPLSVITNNPSLKRYPHNTIAPCPIASIPALSSTSIASLALLHRSRIDELRAPSSIESIAAFIGPPVSNPNFLLNRAVGTMAYTFSNQVVGNLTFPTFGGGGEEEEVLGFCEWFLPFDFDHNGWINKYGNGYQIICKLRDYRWRALVEAVQALEEGAGGSLVYA